MRAKLNAFLAFLMTALMLFEAVPSIAYAEAAERIGEGAEALSEAARDGAAEQAPSSDQAAAPLAEAEADGATAEAEADGATAEAEADGATAEAEPLAASDAAAKNDLAPEDAQDVPEAGQEGSASALSSSDAPSVSLMSGGSRPGGGGSSGTSTTHANTFPYKTEFDEFPSDLEAKGPAKGLIEELMEKIGDVNETLAQPEVSGKDPDLATDEEAIAKLSIGEDESGSGIYTIDVEIIDDDYLALNMLSVPFLSELFDLDGLFGLSVGSAFITKDALDRLGDGKTGRQFALMLAVAYNALGPTHNGDININNVKDNPWVEWNGTAFTDFTTNLRSNMGGITIGSLDGAGVPVTLYADPEAEGETPPSVQMFFRFFKSGTKIANLPGTAIPLPSDFQPSGASASASSQSSTVSPMAGGGSSGGGVRPSTQKDGYRALYFDGNGGINPNMIVAKSGQTISSPMYLYKGMSGGTAFNPFKLGYSFAGWDYDDLDKMPAYEEEPSVVTAKWEPLSFTLSYGYDAADAISEAAPANTTFTSENRTSLASETASVTGKTFAGWKLDAEKLATSSSPWNGIQTGLEGETFTGDSYQKLLSAAEDFEYAKKIEALKSGTVPSTDSLLATPIPLVAVYKAEDVTITLDPNDGQLPPGQSDSITRSFGAEYGELPQPTRAGYVFQGWFVADDDGEPSETQVTEKSTVDAIGTIALVARWSPAGNVQYKVRYFFQNTEGDDYTEDTDKLKTFTNGTTNETVYANKETFDGFDLDESASTMQGEVKPDGSLELALYYKRKSYTITFSVVGGSVNASYDVSVRYDVQPEYPQTDEWNEASGTYRWEAESGTHTITGWKLKGAADGQVYGPKNLPKATADATYVAQLESDYEAETPDGKTTWRTLELAMEKAPELVKHDESGAVTEGVTLALAKDRELEEDLTVPEGITLILPYEKGDTGYHPESNGNQNIPGPPVNPSIGGTASADPYRTLTVAAGKKLTVKGTVLVNALIGHKAGGYHVQDVTGGWALLKLDPGASVVVEDGGTLDAHGYVRGNEGSVIAEPGGTVGDLYVVQHWRGGSQALDAYGAGIYPMNETDCRHVEVPLTIEPGGRLDGLVTMNASFEGDNTYFSTRFPQVDQSNGLIRLHEGASATRTLVERKGEDGEKAETREHWEITGGADFGRSTLYIIEMDLTTGDFLYPIDGDTDWVLKDGDYAFTEDFKFMPGAKIEARGADLTVAAGKTVVLYEPFEDPATPDIGDTQYPNDRPAATLTLDADSSLTNAGTFAGTVIASGPDVHEAQFDVGWEATTNETNGSHTGKTYDEFVREIPHGLTIECPDDHEYVISDRGEVLWDGAESAFHPEEELARAVRSAANKADALEGMTAKATATGTGVELAIDLQSEARASGSAVSAVEDVVTALLDALSKRSSMIGTASAGSGKDRYTVDLSKDTAGLPVRDLAKALGLVAAAGGDGAKGADLAGKSARLTVSGTGFHAGVSATLTIAFTCSYEPPVAPSSPTAAPDTSDLVPEAASIIEASEPGRVELNEGDGDGEAAPVEVAATVTDPDAVTWTVTLADEAQEKPAEEVAGQVIGSFLESVAKSPEAVSRVSTVTGNPPEVTVELTDGRLPEDGLARILAKLGLAQGAAAQALADDSATDASDTAGDVLVGESYRLRAESPRGDAVTFTFAFRAADAGEPAHATVSVHRLYNAADKLHLYTADKKEIDDLKSRGWTDEGELWRAPAEAGEGAYAVVRLYNPNTGAHYYCREDDLNQLSVLEDAGWARDGSRSSILSAPAGSAVEVATLFNPHERFHEAHLYTTDANEAATLVSRDGWQRHATVLWGLEGEGEGA